MTDPKRPKPYPAPAGGDKPACPFWGGTGDPAADAQIAKDYKASESTFLAVVEAIGEGDAAAFKALCDSVEPRDYAVAAYFFADFLNGLVAVGIHPANTFKALRKQLQDELSAALAE